MSKYTKLFETTSQYEDYINGSDVVFSNVCVAKDAPKKVYYNPISFFAKLYLNNGKVIELQGSGALTGAMVSPYKSSVVSAEIGKLCTSIGEYAFSYCTGLTSIVVDSGNTVFDSRDNCNAIIKTSTNELIAGCKTTVIPNTVTSIGNFAFNGCTGLTSITIPNSVTSIGEYAFSYCSGLTSITIPNNVTNIGQYAFNGCRGLTSITIPDSVTSIGNSAFSRTGLTSITIPNSVTSIGNRTFQGCTGLKSITIPDRVTTIGIRAFENCSSLTSITSLAAKAPTIQSDTFSYINTGGTLTVPINSSGYDVWMGTGNYYLGYYGWTKVEQ